MRSFLIGVNTNCVSCHYKLYNNCYRKDTFCIDIWCWWVPLTSSSAPYKADKIDCIVNDESSIKKVFDPCLSCLPQ